MFLLDEHYSRFLELPDLFFDLHKPKKALFYHDRGVSNEALGQHEAAEADFDKAKELDPKEKRKL